MGRGRAVPARQRLWQVRGGRLPQRDPAALQQSFRRLRGYTLQSDLAVRVRGPKDLLRTSLRRHAFSYFSYRLKSYFHHRRSFFVHNIYHIRFGTFLHYATRYSLCWKEGRKGGVTVELECPKIHTCTHMSRSFDGRELEHADILVPHFSCSSPEPAGPSRNLLRKGRPQGWPGAWRFDDPGLSTGLRG